MSLRTATALGNVEEEETGWILIICGDDQLLLRGTQSGDANFAFLPCHSRRRDSHALD